MARYLVQYTDNFTLCDIKAQNKESFGVIDGDGTARSWRTRP